MIAVIASGTSFNTLHDTLQKPCKAFEAVVIRKSSIRGHSHFLSEDGYCRDATFLGKLFGFVVCESAHHSLNEVGTYRAENRPECRADPCKHWAKRRMSL